MNGEGETLTIDEEIRYLPPEYEGLYSEDFTYTKTFDSIGPGKTVTDILAIDNDTVFVCTDQCAVIWDPAAPETIKSPDQSPILASIKAGTSAVGYSNDPVHLSSYFGTAQRPYIWKKRGFRYTANQSANLTLSNIDSAKTWTVQLTFNGFKVFNFPDSKPPFSTR